MNDDMRVFISADIEGCTGLVSWSQCGRPDGQHYDFGFARRMMTHDVNAAIRGARFGGAKQVLVKDSHGNSKNLLIDELEAGTQLVTGHGSAIDGMMQGVDSTFDCAVLIGYHAMAGTRAGVMEHTISGRVHRLWINGQPAGEIAMSAGVAGQYGVPVVTVSSDQAGCDEVEELLDGVETACVKFGVGRHMARCLHPSETAVLIEEAARRGVQACKGHFAWRPESPVTFRIEFNGSEEADAAGKLVGCERIDAYTVEFSGPDYATAHRGAWNLLQLGSLGSSADQ
ncbi:MAG: M55 family metallopeptidase [Fimbriimonadaceae bacterium]|nr:M55 family metallopeptidase [Fimbriimonadaceae bacterium]